MTFGSYVYGGSSIGGASPLAGGVLPYRRICIYFSNLLESSTVTPTSENSSFPKYRLHDRQSGLLFKGATTPAQFIIALDTGSLENPLIDTLIISNHNLSGLVITLQQFDGSQWIQVLAWIGYAGMMKKEFTPVASRYWYLTIFNPTSAPEMGEYFLTKKIEMEAIPLWGYSSGKIKNINRLESKAGYIQKVQWGKERKVRRCQFEKMSPGAKSQMEILDESVKNFYIEDIDGQFFFAELPAPLPEFIAEPMGRWGLDFTVQEVLD